MEFKLDECVFTESDGSSVDPVENKQIWCHSEFDDRVLLESYDLRKRFSQMSRASTAESTLSPQHSPKHNDEKISVDKTEANNTKHEESSKHVVESVAISPVHTKLDMKESKAEVKSTSANSTSEPQTDTESHAQKAYAAERKHKYKSSLSTNANSEVKQDAVNTRYPKQVYTSQRTDKMCNIRHKDDMLLRQDWKDKPKVVKITAEDTKSKNHHTSQRSKSTACKTESNEKSTACKTEPNEKSTACKTEPNEKSTACKTESNEKSTACKTESNEKSTACKTESNEKSIANVTETSEKSTACKTEPNEKSTACETEPNEKSTACKTESNEKSIANVTETRDKKLLKQDSDNKPKSHDIKKDQLAVKEHEVKSSTQTASTIAQAKTESNLGKRNGDILNKDKNRNTHVEKRTGLEAVGHKTKDRQWKSASVKRDGSHSSHKRNEKSLNQNKGEKAQPLTHDDVDPTTQQTDVKSDSAVNGFSNPKTENKHKSSVGTRESSKDKSVKAKPPKDSDRSEKSHNLERDRERPLKREEKKKTTYLYLQFNQLMKDKRAIHSFLKQRLKKLETAVEFQVVDYVKKMDENYAIVTLEFSSKHTAHKAQHLFNLSNHENPLKIFSTFDLSEVDESRKVARSEAIFEQQLTDILRRARKVTERHQAKINKTQDSLQSLKSKKQMTMDEFEIVTSKRFALEDKLNELQLQIAEFRRFMDSLTSKLTQCWEDNTYDKHIKEIRKLFAVECCRLEGALPMYAQRKEIVKMVSENQVCVILGETGSGKSTQVVQYLYQVGFGNDGMIVCTQPRKVAAISLATRVASEMDSSVGQLIGYRVGMKSKFGGNTKILYTTDHALLNDCLQDPSLSKYSCVIIDEAHERSIYTDLLLGMLKQCISRRPELKVIITSATIDPGVFVSYFNGCPILKVSGRMFPVEVIWQREGIDIDIFENYQDAAVETAAYIHRYKPDGDVLVFMTTPLETERCRDSLKQKLKNDNSYVCLVLHGQAEIKEQQQVFQPPQSGMRKIVFATNSAETSITIPGIKYVVDTGLVKEKRYDSKRNMDSLNVYMISRSSAEQRKGRAGRTGPGTCYRLYSKEIYENMQGSSAPEILRVHLGQAMLKLAELGINPQVYDFVQSPDKTAIAEAMKLLEEIGAIKDERITETGRLLTKLPVEPRHGMIIAKGKEHDIIYEAVILSVISSTGNSLFFRGGTQKDKEKADLIKLKFCSYGGDSITLFNVYKQWDKEPEKKKNGWCFENFVNSKVIRGVRETVNEICSVLKKELQLNIKHSIDDSSKTDEKLQKILFECFSSNICHYLGHERAGYYSARLKQLVHIHPSSALKSLGLFPQWVTFEHVMKTSKDFVTGLTPVDECMVTAAIENGTLPYDIEEMKHKQVYPVYTQCVGSRAFWSIVGPAFSKMRTLEEKADELAAPCLAVIEADKEKGEISVISTDDCSKDLSQIFKGDLDKVKDELEHEDCEFSLSEQAGSVRVVIGSGGEISQLIMPEDYRTVIIEKPSDNTTEEVILDKFGKFGVIKTCREFNTWKNNRWGSVTFEQAEDAKRAVQETESDSGLIAVVKNRGRAGQPLAFKAKLTWCRRKSRGFAFVDISKAAPDACMKLKRESSIQIREKLTHINSNTNAESSLHLRPLTLDTDETDIKSALLRVLGEDDNSDVIERVTVVRNNVETTKLMLDSFKSRIKAEIIRYAPSGDFTVEVVEPRPKAVNYLAFVKFRHPEEGNRACRKVSRRLTIGNNDVNMVPDISAELYIEDKVMRVIHEYLEDAIKALSLLENITSLKTKQLKHGNFVVDIHAACTNTMADVRSVLQDIIQGDVLEHRNCPFLKHMFTRNGRKYLEKLQSKFNCVIVVDNRTMTISIKANAKVKNRIRSSIDDFLQSIAEGKSKEMYLKGPDKPGGVMKMLTLKYGIDLDMFQQETGLLSVQMDFRRHMLDLRGSSEAIEKAESIIADVISDLTKLLSVQLREAKRPECVVCFLPIEQGQLYRLEACGHPYCTDCIKQQLQHALRDKDFPLDCIQEECRLHFMWRDVSNFIRDGSIVVKDLVAATVSAFVARHMKGYRYCITPNCPVVYRVSSDGSKFLCPECQTAICTTCHVQYHDGLSCAMYKSPDAEGDRLMQKWMRKTKNVTTCPECGSIIQKVSGCNHVCCTVCNMHICWNCKEIFQTDQECYAHLANNHGGFA